MTPSTRSPALRGFTLIEVLVVIVLIGILATFAVMSLGDRAAGDRLESESQRVGATIQLAADEAQLKGLQIGMRFSVSGYQFVVADDSHHWQPYAQSGPLRARQWPDGMAAELSMDGHIIAPAPDNPTPAPASQEGENAAETNYDPAKDPLRPQVLLLSSGEMTPFALDLKAIGVPIDYHFEGDLLGRMSVSRKNLRQ